MKKIVFLFLILTVFFSCKKPVEEVIEEVVVEEEPEPVYRLPDPQRVFFYRDGTTVYEASIPVDAIVGNAFILPLQVDQNSFTMHRDGTRIFSYTLETATLRIQLLDQDPKDPEVPLIVWGGALLVTVPDLEPGYPLDVKFGIGKSGMTWKLVLDMEAAEANKLECNLLASIETRARLEGNLEYILAKRPEVILLPSTNIFLEGSEAVFNLGNPLIQPDKTTFMKLEGGQSSYRLVYRWDANEQDRPSAYLYCSNPFSASISGVQAYLNSNGLNISDYSLRLIPGRQIELLVGNQPLITTFKSVRTQEFPKKDFPQRENLPYTHSLEYTATNQLPSPAELEISVPVSFGKVYRNQYTFQRQPDERPGERMIWKYRLNPGATARVEFRLDSESKDNTLYATYDYYSNGR
jgi:hypothetical protein